MLSELVLLTHISVSVVRKMKLWSIRCPRYAEARRVMKDDITTTLNILNRQRKKKRKVEINDTLLLTPYSYGNSNNINRKEDIVSKRHYLNSCLVSIEEFDL